MATDAGDNLTLQATAGPDGQLEDLKYLSVNESAEMLGVWIMSPSGNKTKLIQVLKWAAKVKLGRPSKAENMDSTDDQYIGEIEIIEIPAGMLYAGGKRVQIYHVPCSSSSIGKSWHCK